MNKAFFKRLKRGRKVNRTLFKKLLAYFIFLYILITAFLGFFFVMISGSTFKKQIMNYASDNMSQIIHSINLCMHDIDKSMINLAVDRTITTLINNNMPYGYMYNEYMEVLRTLVAVRSTNSFLDSVYLYVKANEKIVTSNREILDLNEFGDLLWLTEYDMQNEKTKVHIRTHPITNHITNKQINAISLVRVLPVVNPSGQTGVLAYNINEDTLNQVINRKKFREGESVFIIDSAGNIISSENKNELYMNYQWAKKIALFEKASDVYVDDINGIKSFVVYGTLEKYNWRIVSITAYDEIFETQSKLNALSVMVLLISVLIVIPVIIVMSKKIYSPISDVIGILVNGNTTGRIPVENDIEFINESILKIITDKERIKESFRNILPAARESFFRNILNRQYNTQEIKKNMKTLGIEYKEKCFTVVLVEIDNILDYCDIGNEAERRLLMSDLKRQIANYLTEGGCSFEAVEVGDCRIAIIFDYATEKIKEEQDRVYYLCLDLKEMLTDNNVYTVTMGIGQTVTDFEKTNNSYEGALRSIKHKLMFGKNNVIRVSDVEKDLNGNMTIKFDYVYSILKNLRIGNTVMCIAEINTLIDMIANEGVDTIKVYRFFIQFVNSISFALYDMGENVENIFGTGYDLADNFIKNEDLNDIKEWFVCVFNKIGTYMEEKKKNSSNEVIYKVKSYIENNLDKGITLNEIASKVYLNPSYLGKLFKRVEGLTFNEYLNRTRMEKAKKLLMETDMKISKIAAKVGISNSKYFTYCFKSFYGVTPRMFRKNSVL